MHAAGIPLVCQFLANLNGLQPLVDPFAGTGKRYFGVELEVDEGGESDSNAERVLDIANTGNELIYCKHDGSLNNGFEIVTHPMTLDFHENNMPWAEIMEEAKKMGYLSHQAETCGLHVHVNRTTFGDTESEQEAAIARVLYFFEKFWEELLKFSRRTQRQLDHWAARYGYKEKPKDILDHAKGHNSAGRYTAVNLTNRDTVEFRMFRGTLKYNTLIATLELLDNICEMAVYLTDKDVQGLSWTSFVVGCTQPELVQYLKERRLYVNDAVASEEDVYAVAAIQSGDDIKTVQGNLGHATASFTLDVYGHVTDQMKQNSAVRMEKFIEKVSGE